MDYEAKRILLCLRYGIGDVIMELPALDALRAALPRARITALGAEPAIQLLQGDGRVDAVESLGRFGLRHRWHGGEAATRTEVARWVEEQAFDLYLDVHHVAPPFGEVVWRGVRSLEADEWAEAQAVGAGADGVAAVKAAVWAGWGLPVSQDALPDLRLREEERRFAAEYLMAHGLSGPSPVGISPVASATLKRWPVDRFAAAASRLAEETGRSIVLFAGPQDDVADALERGITGPARVVRVGALPLRRVAAVLERCGLLVCNDTGLMHMAAAVGTPVVAVFGPTSPQIYLPPSATAFAAGATPVECPHLNTRSLHPPGCWAADRCLVAEHGCIHRTSVDDVVLAAQRALSGATRRLPRVLPAMAPGA